MSNNNSSNQESNPQKESNQDKGKHDLYKNTEPQKSQIQNQTIRLGSKSK